MRIGLSPDEYAERIAAGQKWCRACRSWHQRSAFGVDRSRGDGRASRCKASFVRRAPGPTIPERHAARARGEAWCRRCDAWCPLDDVRAGACRIHRNEMYREAYAAAGGNYKRGQSAARRRGIPAVPFTARSWLLAATGGLCAYDCGRPATTMDHVIPVANGGDTSPGNMVPACVSCNSSKKDRDPWPWILRMSEDALSLIMPGLLHGGALLELI